MEVLIFFWLLFGIVAALIGSQKGQGCLGFILGVLLVPFGILIIIFTGGNRISCPYCKERIRPDAIVCPHCQREIKKKEIRKNEELSTEVKNIKRFEKIVLGFVFLIIIIVILVNLLR